MFTESIRWLLEGALDHLEKGNFDFPIAVVLAVLWIPTLWAIYVRYYLLRKIEDGHKLLVKEKDARLADKDKVILRLEGELSQADARLKELLKDVKTSLKPPTSSQKRAPESKTPPDEKP